jgi:sporulation protein YlmC with PRC-barrel domain
MNRLAWLEGTPVVAEDGGRLGRVFELRSPGAAETEPLHEQRAVDCLLCGRRGLLERLGWKEPDARVVPWSAVVAVRDHEIIVRGHVDDYRPLGDFRSEA